MPLHSACLVVGPIETNCYLVWDHESAAAAIIDPGGDENRIIDIVTRAGARPEWILLTHGHFDHAFSAGQLSGRYGTRVGMSRDDLETLSGGQDISDLYYDYSKHRPLTVSDYLSDGDVINLGDSRIQVLSTPGHSPGGLCFVTDVGVFCGDTIFAGSVGRTDFPGGSFDQLQQSIRSKLFVLDGDLPLYPGHGPSSTIGLERDTNPFVQGVI